MEKVNSRGQTLVEFLEEYHGQPHAYPKPALTADLAIFRPAGAEGGRERWQILAVKRGNHPCIEQWALPGGFFDVASDETLEACAVRELKEETGLEAGEVFPLGVYSKMGRDPRDRIVSQLFAAVVDPASLEQGEPVAGDDAADAKWMDLEVLWAEDWETVPGFERVRRFRIVLRLGEELAEQSLKVMERMSKLGARQVKRVAVETIGKGTLAFDHAQMILEAYRWLTGERD